MNNFIRPIRGSSSGIFEERKESDVSLTFKEKRESFLGGSGGWLATGVGGNVLGTTTGGMTGAGLGGGGIGGGGGGVDGGVGLEGGGANCDDESLFLSGFDRMLSYGNYFPESNIENVVESYIPNMNFRLNRIYRKIKQKGLNLEILGIPTKVGGRKKKDAVLKEDGNPFVGEGIVLKEEIKRYQAATTGENHDHEK